MRKYIRSFDERIDRIVEKMPRALRPFMLFFTLLGQPPFTVGVAAVVLGYGLALEKQFYIAAGIIALGTIVISSLLKIFLRRKRPVSEYVDKMFFKTFSFPSGHAAGAAVSYGLAALVIAYKWPEYVFATWVFALILIFLISLSRVYLRAHYASDIIGGMIVGYTGLFIIFLLER